MKYLIASLALLISLIPLPVIYIQSGIITSLQATKTQDKTVIRLQTQLIRDQWLTIQQTKHAVEECVNARSK